MTAYYNEIDPKAAAWLRELIRCGNIAKGEVDERSILEVSPADLRGFTQCHFFAGIGVWSYALRLAGWADDRPVWTGSCPCQPFSAAGKGDEFADERHLWPAWFRLARELRPDAIFGEQVSSKNALAWFDHIRIDLEGEGYALGVLDTCAAGVGAPHARNRLFWVADTDSRRRQQCDTYQRAIPIVDTHRPSSLTKGFWFAVEWVLCRDNRYRAIEPGTFPLAHGAPARVVRLRGYGNAIVTQVAQEFIASYQEVRST